MVESEDIKLHTWTCDVPGCAAIEEVADKSGMGYGPANWGTVKLSDGDDIVLCPDHIDYKPVIRTVLLAVERKAQSSA